MVSKARQLAQKAGVPSGRRNLLINGAMNVAQRGTQSTGITSAGYYSIDRMRYSESGIDTTSEFTHEQVSDAPDGFSNSLKLTTTTAQGGISAEGRQSALNIRMEAQDLQHLKYGSSSAEQLTISFWVKSSLTGVATVGFYGNDAARSIAFAYTINAANTWEYKTHTIPGDTAGSINNDTGTGLELFFNTAAGSTRTGGTLQTSWGDSTSLNDEMCGGMTLNIVDTLNATFQITGIQLEVGSVATPFEHRSYGEELALCQRYFEYASDKNHHAHPCWIYSSSGASSRLFFRVDKRTRTYSTGVEGTIGSSSSDHRFYSNGNYRTFTGMNADSSSGKSHGSCRLDFSGLSGVVSGDSGGYYNTGSDVTTSNIYVDDEL